MDSQRYEKRGVSANKSEVHEAIKHLDKGLYPLAFCKVLPDIVGNDSNFANVMHADTAGTKPSLAYIYHKETGDPSVWKGIIQDAIVMNIDDMACVGITENIMLSSTIGRNKNLIDQQVLTSLIKGTTDFIDKMKEYDVSLHLTGGETADVGDIVRTLDVGFTTFSRIAKPNLVINEILPGQVIVGLASYGQASYETEYNGGMGSNGLTSARHDIFSPIYRSKYPESYDPATPEELVYSGSRTLTETIDIDGNSITLGKLVLSPTRTYMPVIRRILNEMRKDIKGMIHCTGGAQTKVLKFIPNDIKVVKDNLLPIPPLFQLIESESGTSRKEMYQVFNMGHRLEIYTSELAAKKIIDIASDFAIHAQIIGHVESSDGKSVYIKDEIGTYEYFE